MKKHILILIFSVVCESQAASVPLPIMRSEYNEIKELCLQDVMPESTTFSFVYEDYCGCVAQEVVFSVKNNPDWLKKSEKIQPIVSDAVSYCNQYFEWKLENAQPYVKPKKDIK